MNRVLHLVMRAGSAAGRFSSPAADSLCFCSAPYVVGVALLGGKRRARRISDLLQTPTVKLKECNCNHLLITKMTCTYRMWSILTDELLGSIPRDYDAFLSSSSRNFMLVISRSEHAIDHGTMRLCRWYWVLTSDSFVGHAWHACALLLSYCKLAALKSGDCTG